MSGRNRERKTENKMAIDSYQLKDARKEKVTDKKEWRFI